MSKIIAFSLWGKNPKYTIGAVRNAELAKEIYPGWTCRFYTGEDVEDHIKQKLLDNDAEVVEMGGADWNGMFWRFFAADGNDVMISRDTDSRLGSREKAAVDEWLSSDKDFHIMRDHPYHQTEILGGMWGVRNGLLNGIKDMIANYDTGSYDNKYQVDQNFLREVVWPLVRYESCVHDPYFSVGHEFPTGREDMHDFVGQVFDENEVPQF
tara:strand:- start:415 stop:1044 length:630 start_codon:yes stop_codon:yes gene_type:complete